MDLFWTIALAVGLIYAAVRLFEWSQAFKPSRRIEGDPASAGLEYENVFFFTEDGTRLHGWWFPCDGAAATILYCHGNAGNISTRINVCAGLHRLGVNVFIFDYRGYGLSRGFPGEKGLYRDARAAYEVVRARYDDADNPPVILFGASLGGPVAVQLASEKYSLGLILEGSFTSSVALGEKWFPWLPIRMMAHYRFDALTKIKLLTIPKLIAHSPRDQVIPFEFGQQLLDAAPQPKEFVSLAGEHGEAGWEQTPQFYSAISRFVSSVSAAIQ